MEHLQEMATGESIGQMTDDVTRPQKVKVVTHTLPCKIFMSEN